MFSQRSYIPAADGSGRARHLHCELAQSLLSGRKPGPSIIVLDVLVQFLVARFLTEILPVCFNSIKALVLIQDISIESPLSALHTGSGVAKKRPSAAFTCSGFSSIG